MITGTIREEHIIAARERASKYPVFTGSHRGEIANQIGALGEIIVENWLSKNKVAYEPVFTTRTDLNILNSGMLEIKTKDRTVKPRPSYEASVPLYNHEHQQPNFYVFVSLERSKQHQDSIEAFHTAHIVGACSPKQLHERGKIWRAGETDPDNGTTFWTDCWNIHIKDLVDPKTTINYWANK